MLDHMDIVAHLDFIIETLGFLVDSNIKIVEIEITIVTNKTSRIIVEVKPHVKFPLQLLLFTTVSPVISMHKQ